MKSCKKNIFILFLFIICSCSPNETKKKINTENFIVSNTNDYYYDTLLRDGQSIGILIKEDSLYLKYNGAIIGTQYLTANYKCNNKRNPVYCIDINESSLKRYRCIIRDSLVVFSINHMNEFGKNRLYICSLKNKNRGFLNFVNSQNDTGLFVIFQSDIFFINTVEKKIYLTSQDYRELDKKDMFTPIYCYKYDYKEIRYFDLAAKLKIDSLYDDNYIFDILKNK